MGLLAGLFFAGAGSIIPVIIVEAIGQWILNSIIPKDTVINAVILAMFLVAPAEELAKFAVLRLITWKNKHFDYSYDAIVYAVFVSLGFAALENIEYVLLHGVKTGILRMFTAVPGHACYAVAMGFFYSRAKKAKLTNDKSKYALNLTLSMVVPIVIHGIYDAIILASKNVNNLVALLGVITWIVFVLAMFGMSIFAVIHSSKHDFCIVTLPSAVQTIYKPEIIGTWKCMCGKENRFNFCSECGSPRPTEAQWTCPQCGTLSSFRFCGNCGCQRPVGAGVPVAGAAGVPVAGAAGAAPVAPVPVAPVPVAPVAPNSDPNSTVN